MAGSKTYGFIDGVPGITAVFKASLIADASVGTPQFNAGISIGDSSGTNLISFTNDGTNILEEKAASTDEPIRIVNFPLHIVLEGADAPLDLTASYDDGLSLVKWNYTSTGGTPAAINRASGYRAELTYNSTDTFGSLQGTITGYTSYITLSDSLNASLSSNIAGFSSTIDVTASGLDSNLNAIGVSSTHYNTITSSINNITSFSASQGYVSGSVSSSYILTGTMLLTTGAGSVSVARGIYINPNNPNTGTYGTIAVIDLGGGGLPYGSTVTNYYGVRIGMPVTGNGGSVTTSYGLIINEDTLSSTAYEVLLEDGAGLYFRNAALNITSSGPSYLDINSDGVINLNTPKVDATGAISITNYLGIANHTPWGIGYLECNVSTSSAVATIYTIHEYTGSANIGGTTQSKFVYGGSHVTPTALGGLFEAYVDDTSLSSFTLATTYGGDFLCGFNSGSAMSGGSYVFASGIYQTLPATGLGGKHTGGDVYAFGLIVAGIGTPTGLSSITKFGIHSSESIELIPDKMLAFDAGSITNGDTVIYYDSKDSTLVFEHDATEWMRVSGVNIGLGGTSPASTALISFDQASSSMRGALSFILDYIGSSIVANIASTVTFSGSSSTPIAYGVYSKLVHSADASGTTNARGMYSEVGIDNTQTITQGTLNFFGLDLAWGNSGSSNTGGTLYRKAIRINSFGTVSGVSSDTVWGIDAAEPIVLRDEVPLVFGGDNTTQNTTNQAYYDAANSRVHVDGDWNFAGEVSGTRIYTGAGDNGSGTSRYLKGFNGMSMTATRGWVAPRDGSITAVSASLACTVANATPTDIQVRVNGTSVFSTSIVVSSTGDKSGYSTQAVGVDTFSAGDVISLYCSSSATVGTIQAMVELTLKA